MTTWTAEHAEQWMREHPGRWLEDSDGDMWRWAYGAWWCTIAADCLEESPPPSAYAGPLTFHPPREHWAAEAREKVWEIALRWRNAPLSLTLAEDRKLAGKCLDDICALFRAAPEVDDGTDN